MSTLYEKLAKATLDVGGFVTDKTNKEQGYSYISADQVLERAGVALAKVGVVVVPAVVSHDCQVVDRGGKSPRIDAIVTFDMVVADTETELHALWVGRGSDYATPDKALYKAITSGHKYFLMKLLEISVGNEDSEHDEEKSNGRSEHTSKNTKEQRQEARTATEIQNATNGTSKPPEARQNTQGATLTIEEAEREYSPSFSVCYGQIDSQQLANMLNGMLKVKQPTIDQQRKIEAVKVILAARAQGRPIVGDSEPEK